MEENKIGTLILDAAFKVHRALGPGLLESSYQECLYYEIVNMGLYVEKQKPLPIIYNDVILDIGYKVDLMVENKLVVEIKAVESILNIHKAQIITYLKLSDCRLGYLLNFNVSLLKQGVNRIINGFPDRQTKQTPC